jgi:hypothetical protein
LTKHLPTGMHHVVLTRSRSEPMTRSKRHRVLDVAYPAHREGRLKSASKVPPNHLRVVRAEQGRPRSEAKAEVNHALAISFESAAASIVNLSYSFRR